MEKQFVFCEVEIKFQILFSWTSVYKILGGRFYIIIIII